MSNRCTKAQIQISAWDVGGGACSVGQLAGRDG